MNWIFKNESTQEKGSLKEAALFLSKNTGFGMLATTVCVNRGITTPEQLNAFLNPKLESLTSPFKILDLEKAVDHILAIQNLPIQKKIRVFTDYDVDGTTGAALLTWFFRDLQFNFDVAQPDRFKDGYGLNVSAVDQAKADGVDTLITVDCGITNFDAAIRADELGIKLIIVDHHLIDPVRGLPPAFAVIDPQRADDPSGLKQLCGCALGFYLCMGLRSKGRALKYFETRGLTEPNLKNLLDLVVIATAADMVPLTGDNRTLVKHGLDVLRETQKPGLRALIETAGIEVKTVSPSNLGFSLGPRINASGRMGSAETAYRVLSTRDPVEGKKLAQELESINSERADLQNLIWDEVREKVTQGLEKGLHSHAIVVASSNWHEGVVGIVASKVTDHFKKPAIVLAIREDGIAKGSARSYGGYSVLDALHLSKQFLAGYGGHKFAAGLSLKEESVDEFSKFYNEAMMSLSPSSKSDSLSVEARCGISELNFKAITELESLAPFGPGNPEPLFAVEAWVEVQTILKGRHLKLKLCGTPTQKMDGIWFNAAERLQSTELMEKSAGKKALCLFAGIPEINRFMGRVTPTLRIKEAKSTENGE